MAGRLKKYIKKKRNKEPTHIQNHFVLGFIPPNCSITPKEMSHRKQNGIHIFKELIELSQKDKQLLLNSANWCIVIEYIYEQISLENHKDKMQTFSQLLITTTNTLKQQQEYRMIKEKTVQPIRGMIEFLEALGFQKGIIQKTLLIIDVDTKVIESATCALKTKLLLMTGYENLCKTWQLFMNNILKHPIYNKQSNLQQLIDVDFVLNYDKYYDILQKLIHLSQTKINSRDGFIENVMRQIGFNIDITIIQKKQASDKTSDKNNNLIFEHVQNIYDQFRNIENIKNNIKYNDYYKNKNDYNHLQIECISDKYCLSKDETQWRKTGGVEYFGHILNMDSETEQYEELMKPHNWDILIDSICANVPRNDDKHTKITHLEWIRNLSERSLYDEKRRKIKMHTKTAQTMILSIEGTLEFLRGIGFKANLSSNRFVLSPSPFITGIAVATINKKVQMLHKMVHLEIKWRKTIKIIAEYIQTHETDTSVNEAAIVSLNGMNLYQEHDHYFDILQKIIKVNANVLDENKHRIAKELLKEFGLKLNISTRDEWNMKLIINLNVIYDEIKQIENGKKVRAQKINDMEPVTKRLTSVGIEHFTSKMPNLNRRATSQNIMKNILQFGRNYDDHKYDEDEMTEHELDALYDCDDIDKLGDRLCDSAKDKVDELQAVTLQMQEYLGYLKHLADTKTQKGDNLCQDVHCKWNKNKVELYELNQRQIVHVMFYHTTDYQNIATSSRRANRFRQTVRNTTERKRNRRKREENDKLSEIEDDEKLLDSDHNHTPFGWDEKEAEPEPGGKCTEIGCKRLAHVLSQLVTVNGFIDDDTVLNMTDIDHCLEFHGNYRTECIDGEQCPLKKRKEQDMHPKVVQLHKHFYHDIAIDADENETHQSIQKIENINEEEMELKETINEERIQYKFGLDSSANDMKTYDTDANVLNMSVLEFGTAFIVLNKSEAKFRNPKEEMLRNSYRKLSVKEWNDLLRRCVPYAKLPNARKSRLNIKEIVSLKLYTDFDKLQREFRMCFRENNIDSKRDRQKQFFYWNNLIEISCKTSMDAIAKKVYHGVNDSNLNASCFSGTYYGPVSTTTDISVAKGFAGDEGVILELYPSFGAKGLFVSWLSNFPDENEVLYMNVSFQISNIIKSTQFSAFLDHNKLRKCRSLELIQGKLNETTMEQAILNALQTINIDSKILSLNDALAASEVIKSDDSSNFHKLEKYEKLCVLYLLYIQYRPNEWNELTTNSRNKSRVYLSAAFMSFRDQFISLAQNVVAVSMDNMCKLLQIFFYTKSTQYKLPVLDNEKDLNSILMDLESRYEENQPFYFSIIVKLFPSAQQIALNGANFDWSLKRFIDFLDVYDFDFHKIKLQDIYLRDIDEIAAKQRLIDCKSRENMYKLRKLGWMFITSIHLRRVGLKPAPEIPFLLTFMQNNNDNDKKKVFRTHSANILLPPINSLFTPGFDADDNNKTSIYRMDEKEEEEEGIKDAYDDKYVFIDHNPQNCTLAKDIFNNLQYKKEVYDMLCWKLNDETFKNIAPGSVSIINEEEINKKRYKFASECAKVECFVLDPAPTELYDIFYDKYGARDASRYRYVISFKNIMQIFPNLTDLFLQNTTFKLRECLKFSSFVANTKKCKLKRIYFSQTNVIRKKDINKVKLRLKEIGWNFINSQQMICKNVNVYFDK